MLKCSCCEQVIEGTYWIWKRMRVVKRCRACKWCALPKLLLRTKVWSEVTFVYAGDVQ